MASKREELLLLEQGKGCIGKAADDELIFTLRAQDRCAPTAIRAWASMAHELGTPVAKINEALILANQMELWHVRKTPD
jgi:hypothetical protein